MKKRVLFFSIVILFGITTLQAQNGSFMGKRVIFNMGASFSPAWFKPGVFYDETNDKCPWYSFNYTLSPNIEIIAWRLGTVGVNYHYFKTKYYYYEKTPDIIWLDSDSEGKRLTDLIVHGFGVNYKQYFTSRARAPMGTFIKFQLDGFFFEHPRSFEEPTLIDKSNLFAFKLEFGHDFLFFNRLRFSTGLSLGIPFGGYNAFFSTFLGDVSAEDYAKNRILGHYWLGFTVNVGFLAF